MTYQENRSEGLSDRSHYQKASEGLSDQSGRIGGPRSTSITGWVVVGLFCLALVFGALYVVSDTDYASSNSPATTANAPVQNPSAARETTGSGTSTIPRTPPATNR